MQLLERFAALSLAAGAIMSLLPEGSLRRTAGMVIGLLILLCWAEGIAGLLQWPLDAPLPATVLTASPSDVEAASAAALRMLQEETEVLP